MNLIANRLREVRENLGFSQGEFAEKLEIKQQLLSKYETGRLDISNTIKVRLHVDFNVSIDWLLTGNGNIFINNSNEKLSFQDAVTLLQIFAKLDAQSKEEVLSLMRKLGKNTTWK